MHSDKKNNKDLYYTSDHEWVAFQGTVAYTGICLFKLSGFKEIHGIQFNEPSGFKKKGEVIARITYNDYEIKAHMPVDGNVIEVNDLLLSDRRELLLQFAESSAWLALIVPSQPYERKELLLPKQYQLNGKSKYAK